MKNSHKGFIALPLLIAIVVAVLAVGGGAYVYVHNKQANQPAVVISNVQATSTTQTADGSTTLTTGWKTYTNSQHGYSISYPTDSKITLVGYDKGYVLEDNISSTTNWYASTCVQIERRSYWNILISADSQYSSNPCGPTGTSATNHRAIDTFIVNGKEIKAGGLVRADSGGFFSFAASNNIGFIYFVNASSSLDLLHPVLSTFKLIPNFTPIAPPYNGSD